MKLTGILKKQVEKAETKDEKKSLIKNAGMLRNDDELDKVAGGQGELNSGKWYVYCAGIGPFMPGCGLEQEAGNERMARIFIEKNKHCPRCKTGKLDVEFRSL